MAFNGDIFTEIKFHFPSAIPVAIYGVKIMLEFEVKLLGSNKRESSVQCRMKSFTSGFRLLSITSVCPTNNLALLSLISVDDN